MDRNLPITSSLRMYNVLQDKDGTNFVNIFRSYTISEEAKSNQLLFSTYTVNDDDWWEYIAARFYTDTNLWWVVAMTNEVTNPFESIVPGNSILVLKDRYLHNIFDSIMELEQL